MAFRNTFIKTVMGSSAAIIGYFALDYQTKKVLEDKHKTHIRLKEEFNNLVLTQENMKPDLNAEANSRKEVMESTISKSKTDPAFLLLAALQGLNYQSVARSYEKLEKEIKEKENELSETEKKLQSIKGVREKFRFRT